MKYWLSQLPVDYLDASLTQNVWETVTSDLSEGKPAKLLFCIVEQTNNGAAVETIELEITAANPVTGVMTAYTWTLTGIASAAKIYCYITKDLSGGDLATSSNAGIYSVGSYGFAVATAEGFSSRAISLIRVRQTSVVDVTSAQIEVNLMWEKLI